MLSYELFSSILGVLKDHFLPNGEAEEVLKILENCSTLKRMDTVLLFMDEDGFLIFSYLFFSFLFFFFINHYFHFVLTLLSTATTALEIIFAGLEKLPSSHQPTVSSLKDIYLEE